MFIQRKLLQVFFMMLKKPQRKCLTEIRHQDSPMMVIYASLLTGGGRVR